MTVKTLSRREQIITAATELFKARGYAGTSMRDLAQAVGIEAGSLYSHVSAKEEILSEICFSMADKFMAHIRQAMALDNCCYEEKLFMAIKGHVEIIVANLNATSVFWNEWHFLPVDERERFSAMQIEYETAFREIIAAGTLAGEFTTADPVFTTMAILSSLNGLQKWRLYTLPPEELSAQFANLFINGIKAK